MRSDLVFGAAAHFPNRFYLCQLVSKGARKLHMPKNRLQDTTNNVFVILLHVSPTAQFVPQSTHFQGRLAA